jgi:peptide deformylase
MAKMKIEMLGADVLREKAAEIDPATLDADFQRLVDDMFETMYDAQGIGLAGPQVGVGRRVIVVDVKEDGIPPFALVNPRLVQASEAMEKGEEGCLSIPGVSGVVNRPAEVVVEGLDRHGKPMRIEAGGLLARCLQHELDHLDGILFLDRLSPLKRSMALRKYRKRG